MRTYISLRLNRYVRIGVPVNIGGRETLTVNRWAWVVIAAIVLAVVWGRM